MDIIFKKSTDTDLDVDCDILVIIDIEDFLETDQKEDSFLNIDSELFVFARNYNVLRIMSGMGGLSYAT